MKIVVLGKSGQVAQALLRLATDELQVLAWGRAEADLLDAPALAAKIEQASPDAVINAAAYTAVDLAETEPEAADDLNHKAVAIIGQIAKLQNIPLVHISTDYVFEGTGTSPKSPDDPTGPISVYGRSKLAGEQALTKIGGRYAILRTSWVFSEDGNNFVKTMLRLGKEKDTLTIVADQIGGPTSAADIASACVTMAMTMASEPALSGIWHYSGTNDCSWSDFATEIFHQAGIECAVTPIPTSEYPTPAKRPLNSRLDCRKTFTDFGIERPQWKQSLAQVLRNLGELA